jgi:hypothetical protein
MIRRFLGAVDAAFDEEDAAKDRAFAGALDGFWGSQVGKRWKPQKMLQIYIYMLIMVNNG